jgi:rhamnose utilization protein RhaD (predicted bifunctional aldolase and dehydrogenase)
VRERLRPQADVALAFVPYRKPGLPLAHAISERLTKDTNVFVLANHGLVVAGETVAEVADRIARVCEAFSGSARIAPQADIETFASIVEGSDYRLPQDPPHAVALIRKASIARLGSLYPTMWCLGPASWKLSRQRPASRRPKVAAPLMMALPGRGVVVHRSTSKNAEAMARCLADVAARIPEARRYAY